MVIITNEVLAREDKVVLFLSTERRFKCFFTSFAAAALKKYSSSCVCSPPGQSRVYTVDMGTISSPSDSEDIFTAPHLSARELIRDN